MMARILLDSYILQYALYILWFLSNSRRKCTGDVNSISIGTGTNIQDNSLVHVAKSNLSGKVLPTIIGDNVTVGECLWMNAFHRSNLPLEI